MKKIVVLSILVLLSQAMMNPDVFSDEHLPEHTVARSNGFDPIANVSVSANHDGAKKVVDGTEWNIYEITLPEDGAIYVNFDASGSYDPGASNPLELYQWKVFSDQPFDGGIFDLNGHTFNETQASNGLWSYVFQNITIDESDNKSGVNQIRVELTVADYEGNTSEKFRMYFVVVPEAADSDEPNIQFDIDSNGTEPPSDIVYVNGTVLSGAGDEEDVYVEIAFEEDSFNESAVTKYNLALEDLLSNANALIDGDTFSLMLSIESLMGNASFTQTIYIKIYELDENGTVQYSTILQNYSVIVPFIDSDGDGVTDEDDAFPLNPLETTDSDGDGVGDNADTFPNDANETTDSDEDGVGDNADVFPNDANETTDSDGDGVGDNSDAFPNDANETTDSDGDGVGDNSDAYPNDPALWEDDEETSDACVEWEYWNPELVDDSQPGNGCPHYVDSSDDGEANDEETEVSESSEVPFVGFLATLSVFMLAVVFINNEQEIL